MSFRIVRVRRLDGGWEELRVEYCAADFLLLFMREPNFSGLASGVIRLLGS